MTNNLAHELRRAYAALGLKPGTPLGQVRRRYKFLVKRWHPDRYANDSVGQAEATNRLRVINTAYRRLAETLAPATVKPGTEPSVSTQIPKRERLTREEIEFLVKAIGTKGPIDRILGPFDGILSAIDWVGSTIHGVGFLLFMVISLVRLFMLLWTGEIGDVVKDPVLIMFLCVLVFFFSNTESARS